MALSDKEAVAQSEVDALMENCAKRWQTREGTYQLKRRCLKPDVFFFFLHCRTSARHCRSTTGMSEEKNQISPKAKANKNKHTNQTKQLLVSFLPGNLISITC